MGGNSLAIGEAPREKFPATGTRTDSGMSILKAKLVTTKELVARRGENFARITWQEASRVIAAADVHDGEAASSSSAAAASSSSTASGRGGPSIVTVEAGEHGLRVSDQAVLFLDVRPPEEFAACRLSNAVSWPAVASRQDRWPSEIWAYKYQEGKGIVLYDSNDSGAGHVGGEAGVVATRLVATGQFPNVCVLTGGINGAIAASLQQPSGRALGTLPSAAAASAPILPTSVAFLSLLRGSQVLETCLTVSASVLPPPMQAYAKRVLVEVGIMGGSGSKARFDGPSSELDGSLEADDAASTAPLAAMSPLRRVGSAGAAGRPDRSGTASMLPTGRPVSGGAAVPARTAASVLGPSSLLRPSRPHETFGSSSRFSGPIGGVSSGVAMGAKGSYTFG